MTGDKRHTMNEKCNKAGGSGWKPRRIPDETGCEGAKNERGGGFVMKTSRKAARLVTPKPDSNHDAARSGKKQENQSLIQIHTKMGQT
jgi:hypothetical protein